jgi:hypothetical protein
VNAALAAGDVLEVLHRIRHVHAVPGNACLLEGAVKNAAGRSDEGEARFVFAIAGLLANQHDRGRDRPLPEYSLRGISIERATLAAGCVVGNIPQDPLGTRHLLLVGR